jgi:hypothetical protein
MNNTHVENSDRMVRITVDLPISILCWIDHLKSQMGLRTRGLVITMLLQELLLDDEAAP